MFDPRRRRALFDFAIVLAFAVLALLPWESWLGTRIDLAQSLAGPSLTHPLGTDNLGRDVVVRVASAVRGGVLPLWLGVVFGSFAGLAFAVFVIVLGEARRTRSVPTFVDLVATVLASIPVGLVAFAWAVMQERAGLTSVLLTLTALFAVRIYLEVRDLFRHDSTLAFWTAHSALGGSLPVRIWRYGILAGWKNALLRTLAFHLRAAVAIEASLSYLGFGIQEPQASFGNMLASHFDLYLKGHYEILLVLVALLLLTAALPGAAVNLATRSPKQA